jgi:hypothetical protein
MDHILVYDIAISQKKLQPVHNCPIIVYNKNGGNKMEFMTIRELSKSPKDTLTRLSKDGKAVLTNNGKPQALIFKVDGESFERTLSLLQKLEFMQNLTEMRLMSLQNGNTDMTMDEINAEISAARKERKNKSL